MKRFLIPAVAVLMLSGCVTNGMGPNQTGGTLIGAAAGGLVGSQFGSGDGRLVATAAGTLFGAAVGGSIGQNMDQTYNGTIPTTTYVAPAPVTYVVPAPQPRPRYVYRSHTRRGYTAGYRRGYRSGYNAGYDNQVW